MKNKHKIYLLINCSMSKAEIFLNGHSVWWEENNIDKNLKQRCKVNMPNVVLSSFKSSSFR